MTIIHYSEQLQSLSKQYAKNVISFESYVKNRELILNNIDIDFNDIAIKKEIQQPIIQETIDEDITVRHVVKEKSDENHGTLERLFSRIIKK